MRHYLIDSVGRSALGLAETMGSVTLMLKSMTVWLFKAKPAKPAAPQASARRRVIRRFGVV